MSSSSSSSEPAAVAVAPPTETPSDTPSIQDETVLDATATSDSTPSNETQQHKKKKKVTAPPAPCPASVSMAYLIVRGAVQAVLGINMDDVVVSPFQPTYLAEQAPTGKFGMAFGKKFGQAHILLGVGVDVIGVDEKQRLYQAIVDASNRILQQRPAFKTLRQLTKAEALQQFGPGVLDASHAKLRDDAVVTLGCIDDWVLAVPPGTNTPSYDKMESIQLDVAFCDVSAGKKAKKTEVTLKFRVIESSLEVTSGENATPPMTVVDPQDVNVTSLRQTTVRCPEGQALLALQEAQLPKAAATTESSTLEGAATTTTTTTSDANAAVDNDAMVVTIENVSGKIDYNKLVEQFGSKLLEDSMLQRLNQLTAGRVPRLHRFLRRNIFFSHRDFDTVLSRLELLQQQQVSGGSATSNKQPIPLYLYTGRGPSSESMHMGHLIPFLFTQWLQQAFDCPLVIQMTDDEKFLFKGVYEDATGDNLSYFQQLTMENAKDIIACGFDYNKTFIFSDLDYVGRMYPNIVRIWKAVTANAINGIFGFDGTSNIGKMAFPAVQAAPSFATSFPTVLSGDANMMCLIPCAIDQDPYFRMTRDVAHKLVPKQPQPDGSAPPPHPLGGKPALIHSKFFPPLQGATGKMSSSDFNSAIFLTDTPEEIERKIKEHAFSGGRETKKLQQELGANLEVDVSYQWLRFFLEDDDELERIGQEYGTGQGEFWSTGKVKQRLIEVCQELVAQHQERRAKITNEDVKKWMMERCIL